MVVMLADDSVHLHDLHQHQTVVEGTKEGGQEQDQRYY